LQGTTGQCRPCGKNILPNLNFINNFALSYLKHNYFMPHFTATHHRRSIRLKGYDYSQAGLYFVTICVQNQRCLFGKIENGEMILNNLGKIIENEWLNLKNKYSQIELDTFIIMPNHFHAILQIVHPNNTVLQTVGAGSARPDDIHPDDVNNAEQGRTNNTEQKHRRANPAPTTTLGNIIGYFKYQTTKKIDFPDKLWQRNYYEHIIRNERAYQNISDYIIHNPAAWQKDKFYI
jgi:REP element-mobilizing transposase RayT